MENKRFIRRLSGDPTRQRGAAMVEFALTLMIFLLLLFAIIEFSVLMMDVGRSSQIVRDVARIGIVETPPCDIFDPDASCALTCPGGAAVNYTLADAGVSSCSADATDSGCLMLNAAQAVNPDVAPDNIAFTFACSGVGATNRPDPVPLVTVGLNGVSHDFMLPALFGLQANINLPAFETTRTGEDLYTEQTP